MTATETTQLAGTPWPWIADVVHLDVAIATERLHHALEDRQVDDIAVVAGALKSAADELLHLVGHDDTGD